MAYAPISSSHVIGRIPLAWGDVLWGYERQLIGWRAVVDVAGDRVRHQSANQLEIVLAALGKNDTAQISELLRLLAQEMPGVETQKKWLYLVLSSLYSRRDEISDALAEVELVYADFDYPEDIACFVRYMPPSDEYKPHQHSPAENHERLMSNWKRYLEASKDQFEANKTSAPTSNERG